MTDDAARQHPLAEQLAAMSGNVEAILDDVVDLREDVRVLASKRELDSTRIGELESKVDVLAVNLRKFVDVVDTMLRASLPSRDERREERAFWERTQRRVILSVLGIVAIVALVIGGLWHWR